MTNTKFHENPSSGSRDFSCGRTDMPNLVAFCNFANSPNNPFILNPCSKVILIFRLTFRSRSHPPPQIRGRSHHSQTGRPCENKTHCTNWAIHLKKVVGTIMGRHINNCPTAGYLVEKTNSTHDRLYKLVGCQTIQGDSKGNANIHSSISVASQNYTKVHKNFYFNNDRHYHFPKHWTFLPNHPV
jgi:hypothetical protein